MTGHQPLIAMRIAGKRPAYVSLWDSLAMDWSKVPELQPYPDVIVQPADVPERLDLRFVVGLPVVVTISDNDRLKRLVLACERAGAASVYGVRPSTNPFSMTPDGVCFCTKGGDQTWRN